MSPIVSLAAAVLLLFVPVGDDARPKKDIDLLKGGWKLVALDEGRQTAGTARPEGLRAPAFVFHFAADQLTVSSPDGEKEQATFKLSPKMKPKEIDVVLVEEKGKVLPGIYKLDKDTLIICLAENGPRSKEFVPDRKTQTSLATFVRVKKK